MKRDLFLFTGFGFLGLNLIRIFKNKFKIKVFGKKINYPYKIVFPTANVDLINCNFLNKKNISNYNFFNSIIILTISSSENKQYLKKFKDFVKLLSVNKPKKVILISSVSVYGNLFPKISLLNKYSKKCYYSEKVCKKYFKNLTILRVANIFGILRIYPSSIEKLILQRLNIKNFNFYKFNVIRSYLSIDEFCYIIKKFINKNENSKTYNISNDKLIFTFNEILKSFEVFYKSDFKIKRNDFIPKIKVSSIIPSKLPFKLKKKNKRLFSNEIAKIDTFYRNFLIKKKKFIL